MLKLKNVNSDKSDQSDVSVDLKIRELSESQLQSDEFSNELLIGKRGSGKSWLSRSLIRHAQIANENIYVFSPTDKLSGFYKMSFPGAHVYHEYDPMEIDKIMKEQAKRLAMGGKSRISIILDDCLFSKIEWTKYPELRELVMNARCYNIKLIMLMQFPMGIPPDLRSNFDRIFLFRDYFISNQNRLYEHYTGMFPTFSTFRQVFLSLTKENYRCMVIINRGSQTHILDKIFHYKALAETVDFEPISMLSNNPFLCHEQLEPENPFLSTEFDFGDNYLESFSENSEDELEKLVEKKIDERLSQMSCTEYFGLFLNSVVRFVDDLFEDFNKNQ